LLAIDVDRHGGPDGVANFAKLTVEEKIAGVPTIHTAGGGTHYLFVNRIRERSEIRRFIAKVSMCGNGGFIIAAGASGPTENLRAR